MRARLIRWSTPGPVPVNVRGGVQFGARRPKMVGMQSAQGQGSKTERRAATGRHAWLPPAWRSGTARDVECPRDRVRSGRRLLRPEDDGGRGSQAETSCFRQGTSVTTRQRAGASSALIPGPRRPATKPATTPTRSTATVASTSWAPCRPRATAAGATPISRAMWGSGCSTSSTTTRCRAAIAPASTLTRSVECTAAAPSSQPRGSHRFS